jgi:DNA polymerase III delta subunit
VNCDELSETGDELKGVIKGLFTFYGKEETPEVAEVIVARSGSDIMQISNAVRLLCDSGLSITPTQAERVLNYSRRDNVFDLAVSLFSRDLTRAFVMVDSLLAGGEPPEFILDRLCDFYTYMWTAKMASSEELISLKSLLPSHLSARILKLSSRCEAPQVARIMSSLDNAYLRLVDMKCSPRLVLSVLLVDIADA